MSCFFTKLQLQKVFYNVVDFFDCINRNNALHLVEAAFCPLVRLWQKEQKWRQTPSPCDQRSWFALNSKSYEGVLRGCRKSATLKRGESTISVMITLNGKPLIILVTMKWMINGNESVKTSKTLLTCFVLGKYDTSYSCFFLGSYDTVEINFPFFK